MCSESSVLMRNCKKCEVLKCNTTGLQREVAGLLKKQGLVKVTQRQQGQPFGNVVLAGDLLKKQHSH